MTLQGRHWPALPPPHRRARGHPFPPLSSALQPHCAFSVSGTRETVQGLSPASQWERGRGLGVGKGLCSLFFEGRVQK